MKKILLILTLFLTNLFALAQVNLVPNPSFEEYDTCPNDLGQINRIKNWYSGSDTPDYYNACSDDTFEWVGGYICNVPFNAIGYQYANTGNGYVGIVCEEFGGSPFYYREVIGTSFLNPLTVGTRYYFSMKASLADNAEVATKKLGVLFATYQFNYPIFLSSLPNHANISFDTIISDYTNWVKLNGSFVADSAYTKMHIGNFFYLLNSDTINVIPSFGGYAGSYYYIDDVCLSTDSVYAANYEYVSIHKNIINHDIVNIMPNPASNYIIIENIQQPLNKIAIYNTLGQLKLIANNLSLENHKIDINNLNSGLYIIKIIDNNNKYYTIKFSKP